MAPLYSPVRVKEVNVLCFRISARLLDDGDSVRDVNCVNRRTAVGDVSDI